VGLWVRIADSSDGENRLGFRVTKHGRREVLLATLGEVGLSAIIAWTAVRVSPWVLLGLAFPLAAWAWLVWFFRDPERQVPDGDGLFLSPADGRVTDITQIGTAGALGRDGVQVGVFMNIFDVHVNRAPCSGRIERIERNPGRFLDARDPAARLKNESVTITMTHTRAGRDYPIIVRQIAGLIARRIVTDLRTDQQVRPGQRIGMIKFGSRVELLVPRELAGVVRVTVGQRVKAGSTVLLAVEGPTKHD